VEEGLGAGKLRKVVAMKLDSLYFPLALIWLALVVGAVIYVIFRISN
jgi:hypothetical protein